MHTVFIHINDLLKELKSEMGGCVNDLGFWQTQSTVGTYAILLNEDIQRLEKYGDKRKIKIDYDETISTIFILSKEEAKENHRI